MPAAVIDEAKLAAEAPALAEAIAEYDRQIQAAEVAHRLDAEGHLLDEPDEDAFDAAVAQADRDYLAATAGFEARKSSTPDEPQEA